MRPIGRSTGRALRCVPSVTRHVRSPDAWRVRAVHIAVARQRNTVSTSVILEALGKEEATRIPMACSGDTSRGGRDLQLFPGATQRGCKEAERTALQDVRLRNACRAIQPTCCIDRLNPPSKVEHPFRALKRQFGFVKVRYRACQEHGTDQDFVRAEQLMDDLKTISTRGASTSASAVRPVAPSGRKMGAPSALRRKHCMSTPVISSRHRITLESWSPLCYADHSWVKCISG
jgi:hypothetical protein